MVKEWLWVYWFWVQLLWHPQELKARYLLQQAPPPSIATVIYPTITPTPSVTLTYPAEDRVHVWFVGSDYNIHSVRTAMLSQLQSLYLRSFEQKPYNYRLDSQYENHYIYRADA